MFKKRVWKTEMKIGVWFFNIKSLWSRRKAKINPPSLHQNKCAKNPPLLPLMIHPRRCAEGKQVPHFHFTQENPGWIWDIFPAHSLQAHQGRCNRSHSRQEECKRPRKIRTARSPLLSPHPTMLMDVQPHSNTQPDAKHHNPVVDSIQSPREKIPRVHAQAPHCRKLANTRKKSFPGTILCQILM